MILKRYSIKWYSETCTQIFIDKISSCVRGKCTVACGEARDKGIAVRDMFYWWINKRQVSGCAEMKFKLYERFFRIIGFEGLGNGDTFETAELEHRLLISGMHSSCFHKPSDMLKEYTNAGVIVSTRDGGSEIYKRIISTNNLKNVNGAGSDSE